MTSTGTNDSRRARTGRPRSLTLNTVLEAANRIGLSGIRMSELAAELGIGTATLYNYVSDRDELLRLAATWRLPQPKLVDEDQDWREIVRAHAANMLDFWMAEPQLIDQFMRGVVGPEVVIDYLEEFLAALRRRGFSASDAYRALSAVNTMVFGLVVRNYYVRSVSNKDGGHKGTIRQAMRLRDEADLPNLRAVIAEIDDPDHDVKTAIDAVICGLGQLESVLEEAQRRRSAV